MTKPRVLIFSGYGLNCEEELAFAFSLGGAVADIVHINDLIDQPTLLKKYQIVAFPGGFSYGDDTGSGRAYANKVRNHLNEEMQRFTSGDRLILGVCNGFQILVALGLLPAGGYKASLLPNESARYTVRWVDVKNESESPWLKGIDSLMVPIAHGEGKLYMTDDTLLAMEKKGMIALRYIAGEISTFQHQPSNPTGTIADIAGITDSTKRIFGLMPHPERALFFTQLPHWTFLKEHYIRNGIEVPLHGPGLAIFQNAVKYFTK